MIGEIENAIIEQLKAASAADVLGYHLAAVESLPVDFDKRLPEYLTSFPSAWVVTGPIETLQAMARGSARVRHQVTVIGAAKSLRNERYVRHGVTSEDGRISEVGSYQIALDAAGLLLGQTLDLEIGGFEFVSIVPLYVGGEALKASRLGLIALTLTTTYVFDPSAPPSIRGGRDPVDFSWFDARWEPPLTVDADQTNQTEDKVHLSSGDDE